MFKNEATQIFLYFVLTIFMFIALVWLSRDLVPLFIDSFLGKNNSNFRLIRPPDNFIDIDKDYFAFVITNIGNFTIDLYEKNTPKNVNNFIYLANQGYYNNTKIHRIVRDSFFQGGDRNTLDNDPSNDGFGHTGYFIEDEINWDNIGLNDTLINKLRSIGYTNNVKVISIPLHPLSIAMANAGPNTNSSQFFVVFENISKNKLNNLQGRFTNIGKIVDGIDVIRFIQSIAVNEQNKPVFDVIIQSINITEY